MKKTTETNKMKLTKDMLRTIIKEEIEKIYEEVDTAQISKALRVPPGNIKVGEGMIAVKFSSNPMMSRRIYQRRGKRYVAALKKLGFENATYANRFQGPFGVFEV